MKGKLEIVWTCEKKGRGDKGDGRGQEDKKKGLTKNEEDVLVAMRARGLHFVDGHDLDKWRTCCVAVYSFFLFIYNFSFRYLSREWQQNRMK